MAKIKICGLTLTEDIQAVNVALPDYIGFVFAPSRRQVEHRQAETLKALLNPGIQVVGVFVNALPDEVIGLCREGIIDMVQLHGDEDEAYVAALKGKLARPVIRALRVQSADQVREAEGLPCDYLLLDACQPGRYGGVGVAFDWTMIPPLKKPFFLAGGIHAGNALASIQAVNPWCLDVSSGVETDGFKDRDKIMELVRIVRGEK